jgi:hypothetical protein
VTTKTIGRWTLVGSILAVLVAGVVGLSRDGSTAAVVPESLKAGLGDYSISVQPVVGATAVNGFSISDVDAARAARSSVGALLQGSTETSPVPVLFTDADYGEDPERDGSVASPAYSGHSAWMVVFEGASVPAFGPLIEVPGEPDPPKSYLATVVVFVDAETGGLIEAVTL